MTEREPQRIQFRPRARIIRTIGDQLISGPEAAVIELVKNSYDADSTRVIVKFVPPLKAGSGRIIVTDDGHGMTVNDIQEKWMEPATSSKLSNRASPKMKRRMLGSKGIGRFAAAKLGKKMELISVSDRLGDRTEVLISEIDWSIFSEDRYLSDISIEYLDQPSTAETGTQIEIFELNEDWSEAKLSQLYLELRRLVSPLHWGTENPSFRIFLDLSDCTKESCGFSGKELISDPQSPSTEVGEPVNPDLPWQYEVQPFVLINTCDYLVSGHFDSGGTFHGSMEIRRAGQEPTNIDLQVPLKEDEAPCGRVDVQFFIFDRDAEVIRETMRRAGMGELTAARARAVLDEIAGVAIYRDGFRVRPYGDLTNDWLTLDSRRVNDPSLRIGHNQVAGYLSVETQENSELIERSSREGFEENASFRRLRAMVIELFAKVVEQRRQGFREGAGLSRKRNATFDEVRELSGLKRVRALLASLPDDEREKAEKVIDKQSAALVDRIDQLQDRQRVLEAKSSLGLIVGEILHEGAPSANFIASSSSRLLASWPYAALNGPRGDEARVDFPKRLDLMAKAGDRLRALFQNIRPLAGGKRGTPKVFNVVGQIRDAMNIFETHQQFFELIAPPEMTELIGFPEDLTTALVNLFSNSIYWLEESKTEDPVIRVSVGWVKNDALITIEDNGPGIPTEFVKRIFDIRFTLKDGGTGLGLNIAHEALSRSNATLFFDPEYEDGARFEISFPRYRGPNI